MRLLIVGLFGAIFGMIGAFVMIEMIDKSNRYITEKSEHPPDEKKESENGGNSNGHSC